MPKSFNFNTLKPDYLTVDLKDGTKVLICVPKKKTFNKIIQLNETLSDMDMDSQIASMDTLMAEIFSNNMSGRKFDAEFFKVAYEFEDELAFMNTFQEFMFEVGKNPN